MANKEEKAARHEKVESFKKELRTAAGNNMKLAEITEKVKASDWSVDYKVVELLSRKTYVCDETRACYQVFIDTIKIYGGPTLQKKAKEFAVKNSFRF